MEYITFESLIKNGKFEITDVRKENNMTYFKINGYQFQAYGGKVIHEKEPMYNSIPAKIFAFNENNPVGIENQRELSDKINSDLDRWYKHRNALYKIIFIKALELFNEKGEDEFVKYIDHHFFITQNDDNCEELLDMLEKYSTR